MAKRVFKTTKKLSGTRCSYRKWDEWEIGDCVIGKYVGMKIDQYEKPGWQILVEDAQFTKHKEGEALKGKTLQLNSSGQLNKAMEDVEEGQWLQITYNGTAQIEKGKFKGKDAHLVEVDLLEEDTGDEDDSEIIDEEFDEEEDDL